MEQLNEVVCEHIGRGMGFGATVFGSGVAIVATLFIGLSLGYF